MSHPLRKPGPVRRSGRWRLLLMIPAGLCLLAGLDAGLILLDVHAPLPVASWGQAHGMVLVFGFVGALIALERAVALGRAWGYLAPLLLALGGLGLLVSLPRILAGTLLLAGMVATVALYVPLWRRQRAVAVLIQMLGAGAGVAATLLWLAGVQTSLILPWLCSFLVITIAGERVELARLHLGPRSEMVALVLCCAVVGCAAASVLWVWTGTVLFGAALALLVLWLMRQDVARRTIHAQGAPRFMAACLLAGYFWLLVAAVTWCFGYPVSVAAYDTVVHGVFLGFVMSMIMAHAPTILPAVLAIKLSYRALMWVPAVLLHAGLVLRLWLGDGLGYELLWQAGGVLNVVAVVLFVLVALASALLGERALPWPSVGGAAHAPKRSVPVPTGRPGRSIGLRPGMAPAPSTGRAGAGNREEHEGKRDE